MDVDSENHVDDRTKSKPDDDVESNSEEDGEKLEKGILIGEFVLCGMFYTFMSHMI